MPSPPRDPYRTPAPGAQCNDVSSQRHVCVLRAGHDGYHQDRTGSVVWGFGAGSMTVRYDRLKA